MIKTSPWNCASTAPRSPSDAATGVISGTITTLELYDIANGNVMQTISFETAQTTTIAATLTSFLAGAYDVVADTVTAWDIATNVGFDHFGAVTLSSSSLMFI